MIDLFSRSALYWCTQVGIINAQPVDADVPLADIPDRLLRGGLRHRLLCRRATTWLLRQGLKCKNECWYPSGIADVACCDQRLAVECGNTDDNRVIFALARGWRVCLFPYSQGPWEDDDGKLVGTLYRFADDWLAKAVVSIPNTPPDRLFFVWNSLDSLLIDRTRCDAFESATGRWLERAANARSDTDLRLIRAVDMVEVPSRFWEEDDEDT